MKMLVLGLDGADQRIIQCMDMPFTQQLLKDGMSLALEEDLLSRGWAEMLTGLHGSETKGLYLWPKLDGTYDFSPSFSCTSGSLENDGVVPLWSLLNKRGFDVGIQNIPTTGPATKVNGFFVSGGGGGASGAQGIPENMVWPPAVKSILEQENYIFDVRGPEKHKLLSVFLQNLENALQTQVESFIKLSHHFKPEFGFVCFRLSVELQYLAMSEIEAIWKEHEEKPFGASNYGDSHVREAIINHFKYLDKCIESIFSALNPKQYIFTADHGIEPYKHEANVDVFLAAQGWLKQPNHWSQYAKKIATRGPARVRRLLGIRKKKSRKLEPYTNFNKKSTLAFGNFFDSGNFAGIYINDKRRFGGPVAEGRCLNELRKEICDSFNEDPVWRNHNMQASPYRSLFDGARYEHLLPDIRIEKPDSVFFSGRRNLAIIENKNFSPLTEDISKGWYPYSGVKGCHPLFFTDSETGKYLENGDPKDLRLVYHLIDRAFS